MLQGHAVQSGEACFLCASSGCTVITDLVSIRSIKFFYTESLLIDVKIAVGELTNENVKHRKYARWKATYIHNFLKNGETPQAGPGGIEEDNDVGENENSGATSLPTQPLSRHLQLMTQAT